MTKKSPSAFPVLISRSTAYGLVSGSLQIVDLVRAVGFEDHRPVDRAACGDRVGGGAADAGAEAAEKRVAALQEKDLGGGRKARSVTSNGPVRATSKASALGPDRMKPRRLAVTP